MRKVDKDTFPSCRRASCGEAGRSAHLALVQPPGQAADAVEQLWRQLHRRACTRGFGRQDAPGRLRLLLDLPVARQRRIDERTALRRVERAAQQAKYLRL